MVFFCFHPYLLLPLVFSLRFYAGPWALTHFWPTWFNHPSEPNKQTFHPRDSFFRLPHLIQRPSVSDHLILKSIPMWLHWATKNLHCFPSSFVVLMSLICISIEFQKRSITKYSRNLNNLCYVSLYFPPLSLSLFLFSGVIPVSFV